MARRRNSNSPTFTSDVVDYVKDKPLAYVECRAMRHPWQKWRARRGEDGVIYATLLCPNCRSQREIEVTRYGVILKNKITYNKEFLRTKGCGQMTGHDRGLLKITWITQGFDFEE